jgi:hypothetical protein
MPHPNHEYPLEDDEYLDRLDVIAAAFRTSNACSGKLEIPTLAGSFN